MKAMENRIVFKKIYKIARVVDLSMFKNKNITVEYLNELIESKKLNLGDFFYGKDVSGVIHDIRDSITFKNMLIKLLPKIQKYQDEHKEELENE